MNMRDLEEFELPVVSGADRWCEENTNGSAEEDRSASAASDTPACATAECAAGLLPARSENRSASEINKSLCNTSVNIAMSINPIEMPLSFVSQKVADTVLGKIMTKAFCN
jgi:hypothetical protein